MPVCSRPCNTRPNKGRVAPHRGHQLRYVLHPRCATQIRERSTTPGTSGDVRRASRRIAAPVPDLGRRARLAARSEPARRAGRAAAQRARGGGGRCATTRIRVCAGFRSADRHGRRADGCCADGRCGCDHSTCGRPNCGRLTLDGLDLQPSSRTRDDLLAAGDAIPEAALSLHVYDPDASKRFILLNGQRLREGEMTGNGLRVRSIVPDGAVLDHRGATFKVSIEP